MDKVSEDLTGEPPGIYDDWIQSRTDEVWEPIRRIATGEIEPDLHDHATKYFRAREKTGKITQISARRWR